MSNEKKSVLVTGSAGRIGRAVCAELLQRGHRVRGFDCVPTSALDDAIIGDISERKSVLSAMNGMDSVVHLAATPDIDDFVSKLLPNNIVGVYNILECARDAGLKRVILASSGQVLMGYTGPRPAPAATEPSPRNWYAVTKVFAEAAGKMFAYEHGLSVVVVRTGWCPRTDEQRDMIARNEAEMNQYLSPGDAGRFFAFAVEARDDIQFAIVCAASRPRSISRYDISSARELIGYEPRDMFPEGLDE